MTDISIPDPNAFNPLMHLDELPDGDYKTGRRIEQYHWAGNIIFGPYEETIIVKDHKIFGFRLPNGEVVIPPLPDESEFNPPDILFPPLGSE